MEGLSPEEQLNITLKYWDSEGKRGINFNLPQEQRRFDLWFQKTYPPKQLSLFDVMDGGDANGQRQA